MAAATTAALTAAEVAEVRKTEEGGDVEKQQFICVVHKGPIEGAVYVCPKCKTFYCVNCATALKKVGESCWSCETEFKFATIEEKLM